jgi:hypothetical protein
MRNYTPHLITAEMELAHKVAEALAMAEAETTSEKPQSEPIANGHVSTMAK